MKTHLLALASIAVHLASALGAAGDLDATFGAGGKVVTPIGSGDDEGTSVALQHDGKILVAGRSTNGGFYNFAVTRYTNAGELDAEFGTGGKVTTPIASNHADGRSLAVQSDGKIILVGTCYTGSSYDFAVTRYTDAGALDSTFGTGGKITTPIGSDGDVGNSVALQDDGKIVVAGTAWNGTKHDFALVRYTTAGELDLSFGSGGIVTTSIGSSEDGGRSVVVQSDGRIVVAGHSHNGTTYEVALARYTTSGALDPTFGTGGKVTTPLGSSGGVGRSATLQSDGRIIVAGYSRNGTKSDFALVRYTESGVLDTDFGIGGVVATSIGSVGEEGFGVASQRDGKIVVAGYSWVSGTVRFALARYTNDGALDSTFGGDGIVTTPVGSGHALGQAVAVQPDERIVVAGYSNNGSDAEFALVRYLGDSDPPTAVTNGATNVTGSQAAFSGAVDPNGSATVGFFEWGMDAGSLANSTPELPVGSGDAPVPVGGGLGGLNGHTTYYYRAAGRSDAGTGYGETRDFTTLDRPPVANDDAAGATGYGTAAIDVLANDHDPDGDALMVATVTPGTFGSVAITGGGTGVSYTPGAGFCGEDSFSYTIDDGYGGTGSATVTVYRADVFVSRAIGRGEAVAGEPAGTIYQGATVAATAFPGSAAINAGGALAFRAMVKPAGGAALPAIVAGEPPQVVARALAPAPSETGVPLADGASFSKTLFDPVINAAGAVAFKAMLLGVGTSTNEGVWTTATAFPASVGPLVLVAREGYEPPETFSGVRFGTIRNVGLSDSGAVTFVADLVGNGIVASGPGRNNAGVYHWRNGGTQLLLRRGQTLMVGGRSEVVSDLGALNGAVYGRYNSPDGGQSLHGDRVLTRTKFASGNSAVLVLEPGQPPFVAAAKGTPGPMAPAGASWGDVGVAAFNGTGGLALNATLLTSPTIGSLANGGVWADRTSALLGLVARKGDAAPGTGGVPWKEFLPVSATGQGQVVFSAGLVLDPGSVSGQNDYGLWSTVSGGPELVAREGAVAPGPDAGTWIGWGKGTSSLSFAVPDGCGPVFRSNVRFANPATGGTSTRQGLWAADAAGTLRFLTRVNGRMNIGGTEWEPTALRTLLKTPYASGGIRSTNGDRTLVVNAHLRNIPGAPTANTQAIVKVCLP